MWKALKTKNTIDIILWKTNKYKNTIGSQKDKHINNFQDENDLDFIKFLEYLDKIERDYGFDFIAVYLTNLF